jgi:hypothetical protein
MHAATIENAEPAKPSRLPKRRRESAPWDQKFTEPVALSSTASADLPLPGTALRSDFVLLALRARCKQHTNASTKTVKGSERAERANCALFFLPRRTSNSCRLTRPQKTKSRLAAGPKKFAEPVSLSSTASADLPLPGTAFGLGFDLLALRARRKQQSNVCNKRVKGSKKDLAAICGNFFFQHFHRLSSSVWKRVWKGLQRRPNSRHAGATRGSVSRSTSLTHAARNGRASRTTTNAQPMPIAQPASTSAG